MAWFLVHTVLVIGCSVHILLRPHRQPESRIAWLLLVAAVPFLGVIVYILLGSTNIGSTRVARLRSTRANLPAAQSLAPRAAGDQLGPIPDLFRVGQSISDYAPTAGNRTELMADSDVAIDRMVQDIDAAQHSAHVLFYIWLDDHNGSKVADALKRAAARGVACRAMVDDVGSRAFIHGPQWKSLKAAGVQMLRALPVGNPLVRILNGRIDLRNHRKIAVIDNRITYCGSQNCADPAFLPKARFAPWVDVLMRFEGSVVRQNQHLFATDWMGNGGDDISAMLREPLPPITPGFTAQVVATGPTYRSSAMVEMFTTLIFAARHSLFITTPYYVPTQGLQAAICAAADRGVDTTIIFPARNDDFAVGATCRSYYESLLEAGVKVHEYQAGLLHAKTLTLDGAITFLGSANMDRRSFDLNFENNILLTDLDTTCAMRARQEQFLRSSRQITREEVANWGMGRRLWNNTLAIMGPVL